MSRADAIQNFLANAKAALMNIEKATAELQQQEKLISKEKAELQQERANIEHAHQQVEKARDQLESEKATMMKNGVGPNNLVGLNFRGEKTVVMKRSVLCQIENSMLAAMFSGRYEQNLDHDEDGNVYIGYPPSVMIPLMDWLTAFQDAPPDAEAPAMNIPPGQQDVWNGAVKFFGLESMFSQPFVAKMFTGVQKQLKISDLAGWRVALCKPANEITTVADFNLPGIAEDSHVLIGAKKLDEDELLVAAIGRRDFIRDVITNSGWDQHHNEVYWGFNDEVFCFRGSPLGRDVVDRSFANLASCDFAHWRGTMVWSRTLDAVCGVPFEKVIMVPSLV